MKNNKILAMIYGKVDFDTFIEVYEEIKKEKEKEDIIESDAKNLVESLKIYAFEENMKASDIARRLGLNRSSVTRWFNGEQLPGRKDVIEKIRLFLWEENEKLVIEASE